MHEAKEAAKISSGTKYPALPPNSGGGLTVAIVLPLIVMLLYVAPFQVAAPSKTISGIKQHQ
jgi:hypothetical protein